ncbi:MAG: glycosyltransferase family 2 protein [Butyrivibrio sp.]|nr:glycosyltransferase family 2 protein [Butyrivibrio sp.]
MKICVIFTCHNRAEKSKKCVESLLEGNRDFELFFIVVDDGSSDNTVEKLESINNEYHNIQILKGEGNLFYSKGMRMGMQWLNDSDRQFDYVLLINDDVEFKKEVIEKLVNESQAKNDAIIVGAMHDDSGNFTYGGVSFKKGTIKQKYMSPEKADVLCDTFNANCVLIPWKAYINCEPMDGYYDHSFGDFDYGFSLRRKGNEIYTSSFFAGKCNRNEKKGTWLDSSLPRLERLRQKESPKGLPFKSYFYYLNKNFGLCQALLHAFTPYIKILLKI